MIDVSEVMDDEEMGATPLDVRRPSQTVSDDGIATTGYVAIPAIGLVQPASPRAIAFLPEGTRIENTLSVWSATELRGGDGKTQQPDIIVIDATTGFAFGVPPGSYRVIRLEPWGGAGYFHAYAEGFVT